MPSPPPNVDWQALADSGRETIAVSTTRRRVRWLLGFYALGLAIVWGRAVQLELSGGEDFRQHAARPNETTVAVAAPRGRILAREGTVLAVDRPAHALEVHFRYLEWPPDQRWLRRQASARLTRAERRNETSRAAAEARVRAELADLHRRLARVCNLSPAAWRGRTDRIQDRVHDLAAKVNKRHRRRHRQQTSEPDNDDPLGLWSVLAGLFAPPAELPPGELFIVEQDAYHRVFEDLPSEALAVIEDHPDAFPGVRIVEHSRRAYPQGTLAANLIGYVGMVSPSGENAEQPRPENAVTGLLGAERLEDASLRGQDGLERQTRNRRGHLLAVDVVREQVGGGDVVLTIEPDLQRFAEELLDRFAHRPAAAGGPTAYAGGAIVLVDVHSGEVLVAACEPRFDPAAFAAGDARIEMVLADPRRPLFDRVTRMAIPPGSVFKTLVALALVSEQVVAPEDPFQCRGYLDDPGRMRCQTFRQHGIGHGDISLYDALAQSCNVYFFHHATTLGADELIDWAGRCGFGRPAAADWHEQAAGHVPTPEDLQIATRLQAMVIGQGTLEATPLQVARLYAAVANGGYLVEARLTRKSPDTAPAGPQQLPVRPSPASRIPGLDEAALAAVREGLRRTVNDPSGTGFRAARLESVALAGKTGTAETGDATDHAWFAGYVPAGAPRFAFVVALEHGGNGGEHAAMMARQLVERMRQMGRFAEPRTAKVPLPPGKG
ncbi:MAG: hypothetical protein DWQ37_20595 [Planctomycetota bacterium]|nr:MAG: hypothetical protein DWQ37_20595 [Planctomycetota bacterium]